MQRRPLATRRVAVVVGVLVGVVVVWLLTPTNVWNYYDQGYALAWGRQIVDGSMPSYEGMGTATRTR